MYSTAAFRRLLFGRAVLWLYAATLKLVVHGVGNVSRIGEARSRTSESELVVCAKFSHFLEIISKGGCSRHQTPTNDDDDRGSYFSRTTLPRLGSYGIVAALALAVCICAFCVCTEEIWRDCHSSRRTH